MDQSRIAPDKKNKGFASPLTRIRKSMLAKIPLPQLPPELDSRTLDRLFEAYPAPDLAIRHLLRDGSLIRVRRGLYASNSLFNIRPFEPGMLAAMLHEPSCVSCETALVVHGFRRLPVSGCTSVCPGRTREYETSLGPFVFRHLNPARYAFGHHLVRLADGASYLVADPEKALLDGLCLKPHLRSLKRVKAAVLNDLAVLPEALERFDLGKLKIYARRYDSAMALRILLPWLRAVQGKDDEGA